MTSDMQMLEIHVDFLLRHVPQITMRQILPEICTKDEE